MGLNRFAVASNRKELVVQSQFLSGLWLPRSRPRSMLLVQGILADRRSGICSLPAMSSLAVTFAGTHTTVRIAPGRCVRVRIGRIVLQRAVRLLLYHGAVAFLIRFAGNQ